MAGSSVSVIVGKIIKDDGNFRRMYFEISWTADDADGSVPDTVLKEEDGGNAAINGYVTLVVTNPGATAPTANYDITLEDAQGVDIMGGALSDRSATLSEQAMPLISGSPVPRLIQGTLTFKLTNNSINSATGKCYVYVQQ